MGDKQKLISHAVQKLGLGQKTGMEFCVRLSPCCADTAEICAALSDFCF